jgi:hypothetical protein
MYRIPDFATAAPPNGSKLPRHRDQLVLQICTKEQILLSDVIDAIASASLVAQFSVIASEGLRISCH